MIPLMKNTFYKEEDVKKNLSKFILEAPILSMNSKCSEFEKSFANYQQTPFAILFNSGGSANLAILQALKNLGKLKDGAKIGFSSLTWSTNVMPIIQMGFEPVPIDVNINTLNVMSSSLKERIKDVKIDAFFATNVLGFLGDLNNIRDLCSENDILFIEDNCESLGASLPEGKSGNFGIASSFSFYVAHHMSTIEGGIVCSNDPELVEMLKIVRSNGWDRNLTEKQKKKWHSKYNIDNFFSKYSFYDLGFNLRPTEITGFIGIQQLKYLDEIIEIRKTNYEYLNHTIINNPDLYEIDHSHMSRLSPFAIPIICKTKEKRDKYIARFLEMGIEIRPIIAGNMQNQPFYKKYVSNYYNLSSTDLIASQGFYFGNYPEMTEEELNLCAKCLKK